MLGPELGPNLSPIRVAEPLLWFLAFGRHPHGSAARCAGGPASFDAPPWRPTRGPGREEGAGLSFCLPADQDPRRRPCVLGREPTAAAGRSCRN